MSLYRIGTTNVGLLITPTNINIIPLDAQTGGEQPTFAPLATGRLWVNLGDPADYGRDHFWIDEMRTARPWMAHTANAWDDAALRVQMMATADADGYPTAIPAGVTCGTLILTEQAAASAPVIGGRYRVDWQGHGTVVVDGVSNVTSGAGWIEFDYVPTGGNMVGVGITATTQGNHVRGMRCYMVKHAALIAQGKRVNPDWRAVWPNVKLIRFMDQLKTNTNTQVNWSQAAKPSSICNGPSYEEIVEACNELGCDMWINMPYASTPAYSTACATMVLAKLNPALKVYAEWANEGWNYAGGFQTAPYLQALVAGKNYNWMQMAGGRSAETMQAWTNVFAGQMNRLVRVAGVHTGWLNLELDFLNATEWVAEQQGRPVPHTLHDVLAATAYIQVPNEAWASILTTAASNYAAGRAALVTRMQENIEAQRTVNFPHFAAVAASFGKGLVMYEGNSHVVDPGNTANGALAGQLANDINHSQTCADLLADMISAWHESCASPFNAFATMGKDVAAGGFSFLDNLGVTTRPRYVAMLGYNDGTWPPAAITPLALNAKVIVTGHSIPDNVKGGPWTDAIAAMGGTADVTMATGPYATAQWRWDNSASLGAGVPDVRALLGAQGASYAAFIGTEAHGGTFDGRASVQQHIDWSNAYGYALQWHNLAASAGAQTYYMNFWRDDQAQVFGADWRADQAAEMTAWTGILNHVNANKAGGTSNMRMIPLLEVFCAVYDAIQSGTVTGITFPSLFADTVHPATAVGRWIEMATILAVVYRRHPDTLPANAGTQANISSALAAQLRPIIWATCSGDPRTGL